MVWYIIQNKNILEGILTLKSNGTAEQREDADRINKMLNYMHEIKIPMSLKELPLDGTDLKNMGIHGKHISEAFDGLWKEYIQNENFHKKGLTRQKIRSMAMEYVRIRYKESLEE